MLSSFSNFLPQGFSFGSSFKDKDVALAEESDSAQQAQDLPTTASPEPIAGHIDGEHGANPKRRRERPANETFIVVRPPPSVSNHPLNLQLQLVPPRIRERSTTTEGRSSDFGPAASSTHDTTDELTRVESIRSNRSDASVYASSVASTASFASTSSTSTASSSRRMIIPLYNLCAHNVLTNTIVDAGTDAKVVKFNKRGMEVIGLAVLEPKEVWTAGGSYSDENQNQINRRSAMLDPASAAAMFNPHTGRPNSMNMAMSSTTTNGMLDVPHTPESSVLSLSSAGGEVEYMKALNATPTQEHPHVSPSSGPKKLFGKFFKRTKDAGNATSPTSPSAGPSIPVPRKKLSMNSIGVHSRGNTSNSNVDEFGSSSSHPHSLAHAPTSSGGGMPSPLAPVLQPAILGIHPTLVSLHLPPIGRPTRYVWVVTKWLKGGNEGMLSISGMMGKLNVGGAGDRSPNGGWGGAAGDRNSLVRRLGGEDVEVRVEWVRAKAGSRRRGSAYASGNGAGSSGLNRRMSQHAAIGRNGSQTSLNAPGLLGRRTSLRTSMDSRRSRSPIHDPSRDRDRASAHSSEENEGTTASRGSHGNEDGDDAEESDPEDSETPWSCTLTISERAHVVARRVAFEREQERERVAKQQQQQQGREGYAHGHGHSRSGSQYAQYPNANQGAHTSMTLQHPPRASASSSRPTSSASRPSSRPTSANPNAVPQIHTQTLHPYSSNTPTSSLPPSAMHHAATPASLNTPQTIRIKLGHLSPAPHHPKVVAQLKVPFPLPDVEVDGMRIVPRVVTPSGVARSNLGPGHGNGGLGLVLTAEEIKDVLSATAFWLVVREGFGGVGKVNRKGDGWRIRA